MQFSVFDHLQDGDGDLCRGCGLCRCAGWSVTRLNKSSSQFLGPRNHTVQVNNKIQFLHQRFWEIVPECLLSPSLVYFLNSPSPQVTK